MNRKMNKLRMGLAVLVLCALLFMTALPSAANYAYDGFEVKNMINGTVQGDVFASYGSNGGLASSPYTTSYNVPTGTVKWARLYVGIWGGTEDRVGWVNTTFNNHWEGNATLNKNVDTSTYSTGTNVYGSGHGVWMVSYNCTDNVTSGSNSATATTGGTIDGRVYGIALVVVYENTSLPKVQYWVNEGNVNLNYVTPLNNNLSWFNGTAYNSTEANLTVMQYTGTAGQPDYLYLNPPDASDSPFNLSNIRWNVTKYNDYQMDSNDVANASEGGYFDFDSFTSANSSTALKNVINTTGNNYALFWRGWDTDGDGAIDYDSWNSSDEGETYVHPIMTVMKLSPYNVSIEANRTTATTESGVNATYLLSITNYGGVADNYTLTVTNTNSANVAALNTSTITNLGAGNTAHVLLDVTDDEIGDYSVTVTVTSDTDNRAADSVTTVTGVE